MGSSSADRDPVEILADEFLARRRQGELPSISEYTERYPELADEIRELFPTLVVMEEVNPSTVHMSMADTHSDSLHPLPEQLGDYRIIREIGRGAMGVVYEAEQQSLSRRVALKVLPRNISNDEKTIIRFRREARAAARLHHTNIVPIYEVGQDGEIAFYAMQFICGHSLDQVLSELRRIHKRDPYHAIVGPVNAAARTAAISLCIIDFAGNKPADIHDSHATNHSDDEHIVTSEIISKFNNTLNKPSSTGANTRVEDIRDLPTLAAEHDTYFRAVARIGAQVASALSYAHQRGTIHRDIKPSNLLLDSSGVVWVADFGLAKFDDNGHTRTGDIVGTIRYMSPERFQGRCDASADVYSLGITLYEMLVLQPAFESTDQLALIDQISNLDPPRPRSIDSNIPRDLETIVLKAMEKDPDCRYASAKALTEDLRRFLDDQPIRARRVSLSERFVRWTRRNKALGALSIAVSLMVIATALVSSVSAVLLNTLRKEAEQAADTANKQAEELRRLLYIADMNIAQQAWDTGNTQRTRELLIRYQPTSYQSDLRRFEWYYLQRLCQEMTAEKSIIPDPFTFDVQVDFCNSGDLVIYNENGIRYFDAQNWQENTSYLISNLITCSLDGRTLISRHNNDTELVIHNLEDGTERKLIGNYNTLEAVAISSDCKKVVARSKDGTLLLWDAATGKIINSRKAHESSDSLHWHTSFDTINFSSDNTIVASGGSDNIIRLWNLETDSMVTLKGHYSAPSTCNGILAVAFSPDGRLLASGSEDRTVRIWDLTKLQTIAVFAGHTQEIRSVAFSADGFTLASGGRDHTIRIWDMRTLRQRKVLKSQYEIITSVAFSPDGQTLATGGRQGSVKLWNKEDLSEMDVLWCDSAIDSIAIDPNATIVAAIPQESNYVRVWYFNNKGDSLKSRDIPLDTTAIAVSISSTQPPVLAVACKNSEIHLWNLDSDNRIAICTGYKKSVVDNKYSGTLILTFSPNGEMLAVGYNNGEIVLYDAKTGILQTILGEIGSPVSSIAFTEDARLASITLDCMFRLWDINNGKTIREFKCPDGINPHFAFSPNRKILAYGTYGDKLFLLNTDNGKEMMILGQHRALHGIAFLDEQTLVSAGGDCLLRLWDTEGGQLRCTLTGHEGAVFHLKISEDRNTIVSGGWEGAVRIWRAPRIPPL